MKILVIGGYGVFGSRLCQLLAPYSELSLLVAGRSLARGLQRCSQLPHGASRRAWVFERDGDLLAQLQAAQPDLVIDASGPFQAYGADPYRVVKACIASGVDYMDFADGSDFVKGIHPFDQAAKAQDVFVLSGVSSFPVLTAAVARHLSRDMQRVTSIKGGIAPSPFAGVGQNVIRAIAAYAGQKVRLVRHGRQAFGFALTETMRYTIAPPGRLPLQNIRFSLVDVPDLQVLPELWPELDSVWMGAGPVPEVLHRLLNALAWLVRLRLLSSLSPLASIFFRAINYFRWGEHRGGMFVQVDGMASDGSPASCSWHLLAEGDDGPFIPCMAIEAIIKRSLSGHKPQPGARPASKDLELEDYERLFLTRTIFTGERQAGTWRDSPSIFQTLLGSAWDCLAAPIRALHAGDALQVFSGIAQVERGQGWAARAIAALFRFPEAGPDVEVRVAVTSSAHGETWQRTFAQRSFSSHLSLGRGHADGLLCERFGPFTFGMALVVDGDKLNYIVRRWQFCGITLPRFLAPGGTSYESASDGRFCFHVEIGHPLTGLIVRYRGWLQQNPIHPTRSNLFAAPGRTVDSQV
jgi:Domain of unknown function (DUF4166)/Saccharopine dehydrogenase NADP binding domain